MSVLRLSTLLLCVCLCAAVESNAQPRVGALAIERQGDQYGWAVDYETGAAARGAALRECGAGCSVVLTFGRCGAYAADQDADSTAVGWAESHDSADGARQAALAECRFRGGSGCVVRAWGCNGQVIEEALELNRAARRQIQEGLRSAGFNPGVADGLFGPRTRAAIRNWQSARGGRASGYLDRAAVDALRSAGAEPAATTAVAGVSPALSTVPAAQQQPASGQLSSTPAATAELEGLFWQSIMNSTNPADFEAYLQQFPNGVFRALAQNRLVALRESKSEGPTATASRADGVGSPSTAPSATELPLSGSSNLGGEDARRSPGEVFRDCDVCPEMVVMPDGDLALGRYEVTVREYRAFVSATGGGAGGGCTGGDGDFWRNPGFPQTDRHPVTCMSWNDAQQYVSWLSRTTGARYRLPTEAEWARGAAGSQPGCPYDRSGNRGTCPVGSYGSNGAGLFDMVGNLWEWTEDCWEGDCGRRVARGGAWARNMGSQFPGARVWGLAGDRGDTVGFRVSRPLP